MEFFEWVNGAPLWKAVETRGDEGRSQPGTLIAAGSTQDNYGGAIFAVVTCAVVSLVLHVRSSRTQGR